jgi:hypothetical protein
MIRPFLPATWIFAAALLCAASAVAQPVFTQHVPADAVVVISWQGTEEAGDAYDQSRFKAFLDETELPARFGRVFGQLVENAGPDPDTEVLGSFFSEVMPAAIARPWVFYVGPLVLDDRGRDPMPSLGFLIDPGDGEAGEAIERWLIEQFEKVEDQPGAQLIEYGDLLGIVLGRPFLNPDDPDKAAAIKDHAKFQGMIGGLGEAPMLVGYLDADAGRDMILEATLLDEDQAAHDTAKRVMAALGLEQLHGIALTGSFDQRDWVQRMFIDAPAPRTGIPAFLAGRPLTEDTLATLPQAATWFRSMHLDPAEVLGLIRDAMDATGDEQTILEFEEGLQKGSEAVGFDIEEDLLDAAGPRWTIYSEPGFGSIAGFYPGIALMHEPDEPDTVDASLVKFKDWLNAQMQQQGTPFQIASMEMGELTIHSFAFPMAQPGWAIQDGTMYAAASAMAITAAHTAKTSDGPELIDTDDYQAVRKRLLQLAGNPDAEPTGLMYADLPKTSMPMYQSYVAMIGMMGGVMGRGAGGAVNFNELIPPYNAMQKHLAPAGDVLWADEKGLHFVSVSPFPGATLLSPDAALSTGFGMPVMAPPMMFGVMIPAMGAARRSARMVTSMSNVRQLSMGLMTYAADNDNQWPDDLPTLVEKGYIRNAQVLLSASSGIELPDDFDQREPQEQRDWLLLNSSYVLIPGKEEVNDIDSTKATIFEKPDHAISNRVAIGYGDGHVETHTLEEAEALIKKQTGKSIDELVEAAEARAAEGTPDALAKIKAEREKLLEEIRARRAQRDTP